MAGEFSGFRTVQETALAWGVSKRWVNMCIADGRVPGALKKGNQWLLPPDTAKPGRMASCSEPNNYNLESDFLQLLEATILPWPEDDPKAILANISDERSRVQITGEFAYLCGEYEQVIQIYRAMNDDASRMRACSLAIATAIGTGNYAFYEEIESFLGRIVKENEQSKVIAAFAELCLVTASTGAIVPAMVPDWLKNGDFSALPQKTWTDAAYKRAKYYQCIGEFESMLTISQTARYLCKAPGYTHFHDVYLCVNCIVAYVGLQREQEAKQQLEEALRIFLPHGYITPFAESTSAMGGILENIVRREHPEYLSKIMDMWKFVFINWLSFHNHFTHDNITYALTTREYEIASMVARHLPRAQIAQQFNISAGRLNNIIEEIYGKLYVSSRAELAKYIL